MLVYFRTRRIWVGGYSLLNTFESISFPIFNGQLICLCQMFNPNVDAVHLSKACLIPISAAEIAENPPFFHTNLRKSSEIHIYPAIYPRGSRFFWRHGVRSSTAACTAWATTSTSWPWSRRLGRWWMDSTSELRRRHCLGDFLPNITKI